MDTIKNFFKPKENKIFVILSVLFFIIFLGTIYLYPPKIGNKLYNRPLDRDNDVNKEVFFESEENNRVCNADSECEWASGLPEEYGGCGCFNKDFINKIKTKDFGGKTIIECEAPPNADYPCVCVSKTCKENLNNN